MTNRTLIALGDERLEQLDRIAQRRGRSRSAVIRDAVDRFIADNEVDDRERRRALLRQGFGAWRHRTDIGDSVEWQRRERASWTRPWDPDYEEVKAEFPDLFDEQDEREREHYLKLERNSPPE